MVSEKVEKAEMEMLCALPAFRNFLFRTSIQSAGLLGYKSPAANGSDGRNLIDEGRRNLGLDTLHDAARGMPVDDPVAALNLLLIQVLREGAQPTLEEKPSGRRDRYSESDRDDGSPVERD